MKKFTLLLLIFFNTAFLFCQKKISFGTATPYFKSKSTEEFQIYTSLESAILKSEDVIALKISATEKNFSDLNKLIRLRYLYLDETFTSNSYYLNKADLNGIFTQLEKLPDLEYISLYDTRLLELMHNLPNLKGIQFNKIEPDIFNANIKKFPDLEILIFSDPAAKTLPISFDGLNHLKQIELISTGLLVLPESIGKIKNLIVLKILCGKVLTMPESWKTLTDLKFIKITGSTAFKKFPIPICSMTSLEELIIELRLVEIIPDEISNLKELRILHLNECQKLSDIAKGIGQLPKLEELHLSDADELYRVIALNQLDHSIMVVLNRCQYHFLAKKLAEIKNLKYLVLPDTLSEKELKKIEELIPKEKILLKSF